MSSNTGIKSKLDSKLLYGLGVVGLLLGVLGVSFFMLGGLDSGTDATFEVEESVEQFNTYNDPNTVRSSQNLTHVVLTHSGGDRLPYPQLKLLVNGSDSAIGCRELGAGSGDPCTLSDDVSGYTPAPVVSPQPNVCETPPPDSPNLLQTGDTMNVFVHDSFDKRTLCQDEYITEHGWSDGTDGTCQQKVAVRDPEEWSKDRSNHGKPLLSGDSITIQWEPRSGGDLVTLYNYTVETGYPCE